MEDIFSKLTKQMSLFPGVCEEELKNYAHLYLFLYQVITSNF
jgi:hypothetical protein